MRKLTDIQKLEIAGMVQAARTGDFLAVRTTGFFGFAIRCLLSRGLKRCWTNHNAPVYLQYRRMKTMQFEPPIAHEVALEDYLLSVYERGGLAILLRPDVYSDGVPTAVQNILVMEWRDMLGKPYDKESIWMFCRMIFRKRAHIRDNDKTRIYCSEGTFFPMIYNSLKPWLPDALVNEARPAPIHGERVMQEGRAKFIAGCRSLYERIMKA